MVTCWSLPNVALDWRLGVARTHDDASRRDMRVEPVSSRPIQCFVQRNVSMRIVQYKKMCLFDCEKKDIFFRCVASGA